MRNIKSMTAIVGFSLVFNASASESEYHFSQDGASYEFNKIGVYDASKNLKFNVGEVRVIDTNGGVISFEKYNQSPGCNGLPPISSLSVPLIKVVALKENKSKNFIVFCGSYDGPHNIARFYNPTFGFVGAIDFYDGPVAFETYDSGVSAVVIHRQYSKLLSSKFMFPAVKELSSDGMTINIRSDNRKSAELILNQANDKQEVAGGDDARILMKLMAAASVNDANGYCAILSELGSERKISLAIYDVERFVDEFITPKC